MATLYSPGGLNLADTTAPLILAYDDTETTDVVFAVSVSGDLTITPDGGDVTVAGAFTVTGAATMESTLTVTGAATMESTLTVTGLVTANAGVTLADTQVLRWTSDTILGRASAGIMALTGGLTISTTLAATGQILHAKGSAALPGIALASAPNTGFFWQTFADFQLVQSGEARVGVRGDNLQIRSGGAYEFSGGNIAAVSDIRLHRIGPGILGQHVTTAAQEHQWYETYTSGSVYARLALRTAAGDYLITPEALGGPTLRGLQIVAAGGRLGFYGGTAVALQTGVAVSDAAIHAALVNLKLITA